MIRIGLYLSCAPEDGGAFQYSHSILAALGSFPRRDYEIVVAYSHPAWRLRIEELEKDVHAIAVREDIVDRLARFLLKEGLPVRAWHAVAGLVHPLGRQLTSLGCDLWMFPAQDVLTYALPGRTIGVIHDLMHIHEPQFPEVGGRGLIRRRDRHYRNLSEHAAVTLVDSATGKAHVQEAYDVAPTRVRTLPYIAPGYMALMERPDDFESAYDLPARFFFYPAQFWQHKNHQRLVEALALVREQAPDTSLVLAGSEKNALHCLRKRIDQLGLQRAVRIIGYVPNEHMAEFYRRARALVMPTFFGPTNIPPLEAMVAGCPMALSRIYGMPDQIGDAALWFDPSSVTDMASQMLRLATDDQLCIDLSRRGLARSNAWGPEDFGSRLQGIIAHAVGTQS